MASNQERLDAVEAVAAYVDFAVTWATRFAQANAIAQWEQPPFLKPKKTNGKAQAKRRENIHTWAEQLVREGSGLQGAMESRLAAAHEVLPWTDELEVELGHLERLVDILDGTRDTDLDKLAKVQARLLKKRDLANSAAKYLSAAVAKDNAALVTLKQVAEYLPGITSKRALETMLHRGKMAPAVRKRSGRAGDLFRWLDVRAALVNENGEEAIPHDPPPGSIR